MLLIYENQCKLLPFDINTEQEEFSLIMDMFLKSLTFEDYMKDMCL